MQFIPVRSFDSYIDANLLLGRLKEEEINCYLKDEFTVTIDPILNNAVGGIKLMVAESDLNKANEILFLIDEAYNASITCPSCGSHNVKYIINSSPKNWLTAIVSWFFASYAVAAEQVYHCYNCEFEFKELKEKEEAPE